MAYTKTPEQSTHGEFRVVPAGNQTLTAVTKTAPYFKGRRYINCFPMVQESPTTEKRIFLTKAPKIKEKTWTFPGGDSDVGVTAYDYETNIFVYKNKIYETVDSGPTGPTINLLETAMDGETPPAPREGRFISCQKAIDYTLGGDIIVVGLWYEDVDQYYYPYIYNKSTSTLTIGTTAVGGGSVRYYNLGADESPPAASDYSDEVYVESFEEIASPRDLIVDGYHVVALKADVAGTNRVLSSDVTAYNTFDLTTNYFTPEIDPDNLVDIQKHKNYIVVFGIRTIEFYYNSGEELGSPFTRQENLTIRLGALQNLTSNAGSVSIANGDDLYFISNSLNGSNGIYMIREYQATKISDDYIDYILNDQTGLTYDIDPSTAKLGLVDVMGNIQVGVEFKNLSTEEITTFVFNERDKIWWEYSNSDTSGLTTTTNGLVSNFSGNPVIIKSGNLGVAGNTHFSIAGATTNESGATITVYYVNKDPEETSTTAVWISEMQDLGNNKGKHIKYADAIGDYGDNKLDLAFCTKSDYGSWSSNVRNDPVDIETNYPIRWYNLCRANRIAFKMQFVGDTNVAHEALEVSYNIHTQ